MKTDSFTPVDYDAAHSSVQKIGVNPEWVEFCPVHTGQSGTLVYLRELRFGGRGFWANQPLVTALLCHKALVGFLYEDGSIRTDAEMVVDEITMQVLIPRFVVFYRDTVPMNQRRNLALHRGPHDNRPSIIVTK